MQMQIFYILQVVCLLQSQWIINAYPTDATKLKNIQEIHCPQKKTDSDIFVKLFPGIQLNARPCNRSITCASLNTNYRIDSLEIINQTTCIPSVIFCFQDLEKLIIENAYFCDSKQQIDGEMEYFPEQIIKLQKLRTLQISHVNRMSISNIIGKLTSLKDLTISHVKYMSIPNMIGHLPSLTYLSISHVNLMSISNIIGNLLSLQHLSIFNTNLEELPKTISNLKSLKKLMLQNNSYLHSIKEIDGLPVLHTLDVRHCSIQDLPRNLPKLLNLYMPYNSLTTLGSDIRTLSNKENKEQNFQFDNNRITSITPEIRHLHTLSRLHLDHNQLHTLPKDIFDMTKLTYLNLQNNRFSPHRIHDYRNEFNKRNSKLKVYFD
ncbi:unnamed protein product [Adineta steineri]|uniref:Uncharacterized protein n=1 Tax=Adineta steineri TaxID=433720 RepID=A0A816FUY6_9BILA|nr:unnamed protein product [Adineta steineri]CAF1666146.1 unnamed protein product [Adineta steineri]